MQANLDDPLIGKTFSGRFEIVSVIGAGGMGRIYRAVEHRIDRLVALKVLRPRHETANDKSYESRFFLEARMTAKLRHPNTVTLYDYGRSEDGIYFMALELLEGETLQQALRREGPMNWPRAFSIGAQVARSLREAHHLGLVHRDLKPSNIMLVPEGPLGDRVKVLDFGLVKTVTPNVETSQAELELTDEGVVLGSPLYMAPEQARKAIDPRSDVYSLGAVLFAVMSGRTPFVGKKPFDLMLKHMHEQPPELSSLIDVPPLVNALVMRCLEKAPEARFQNMDELLVAMHQAVNALGFGGLFVTQRPGPWDTRETRKRRVEVERVTPPFVRPPPPSRLTRWKTVLAGAVIAGGALGAVVATTAKRTRSPVVTQSPVAATPPVVFEVSSEPSGATVLSGTQSVGVTPLRLSRPREDGAPVRLRLALVLPGYETAVLAVEGKDELVRVHQVLAPNPLLAGKPAGAAAKSPPPIAVTTPEATAPATGATAWATSAAWMMPSAADGQASARPEGPAVGTTAQTGLAPRPSEPPANRPTETSVTVAAAVPRGPAAPAKPPAARRKLATPAVKATTRVDSPEAPKSTPASAYRGDPYEQ